MASLRDLYITKKELREDYGLDLESYAIDETAIDSIIRLCVGKAITTIYKLNDNVLADSDIYNFVIANNRQEAFKKLQYQVIYNYLNISGDDPITPFIYDIIAHELKLSLINGTQKGIFVK